MGSEGRNEQTLSLQLVKGGSFVIFSDVVIHQNPREAIILCGCSSALRKVRRQSIHRVSYGNRPYAFFREISAAHRRRDGCFVALLSSNEAKMPGSLVHVLNERSRPGAAKCQLIK